MHDAAFRAHEADVLGDRANHIEFEFKRSPGVAFFDRRKDRTAECRVEKGGRKTSVDCSDWIVVTESRYAFENRAALFHLCEVKIHQLADRRVGHGAGNDRLQKRETVVRLQDFWRDDAIVLFIHNAPRVLSERANPRLMRYGGLV